jgi:dynein assembly factor 1
LTGRRAGGDPQGAPAAKRVSACLNGRATEGLLRAVFRRSPLSLSLFLSLSLSLSERAERRRSGWAGRQGRRVGLATRLGTGMLSQSVSAWLGRKMAAQVERDEDGVAVLSAATVRALCAQHDGFESPELNDKLYLHFQGFRAVGDGLREYTGVRCLFLESNALSELSGLEHLVELRALYVQQNALSSLLAPALSGLVNLVTLDVSQNMLSSLRGVGELVALQTLNASKNHLGDAAALEDVALLARLASLDLRCNKLGEECAEGALALIERCPALAALYLSGNGMVRAVPHYRKSLVVRFPRLAYLDDRPVNAHERALALAFTERGTQGEAEAREAWAAAEQQRSASQAEAWAAFKERAKAERASGEPASAGVFVSYLSAEPDEAERSEQDCSRERPELELHTSESPAADAAAAPEAPAQLAPEAPEEDVAQDAPVAAAPATAETTEQIAAAAVDTAPAPAETAAVPDTAEPPLASPTVTVDYDDESKQQAAAAAAAKRQLVLDESLRQHRAAKAQLMPSALRAAQQQKEAEAAIADKAAAEAAARAVLASLERHDAALRRTVAAPATPAASAPAPAPAPAPGVDGELLKKAVRDHRFDFSKAAAALVAATGIEISAEQCRLRFASLRSQQQNQALMQQQQLQPAQQQQQQLLLLPQSADENGRPMPKVSVVKPALPSMYALEESDSEPPSADDGAQTPSRTLRDEEPATSESKDIDPTGIEHERSSEPGGSSLRRLTRADILSRLHGSADHPLNAEITELEALD